MNKDKIHHKKRPLSHNPLLNFSHEEDFLYPNPKLMNDELWKKRYNLKTLHEKWQRKVKTNFLNIDIKFGHSRIKSAKLNRVIYNDNMAEKINQLQKKILFSPVNNEKSKINKIKYDKYNDKISYYLSNQNPWNNKTSIERNKINNNIFINLKKYNNLKNEKIIRNKLKNSNEAKDIIIKCKYYNNNYLEKQEVLNELINNYKEEVMGEIRKKFEKEIKLKRYPKEKEKYKNFLVYQEMIFKYKQLYDELYPIRGKNIFLKRCNSDLNVKEMKSKAKDINKNLSEKEKNKIFKELFIIINYLKKNKEVLKQQKLKEKMEEEIVMKNLFDVIEKDEFLRDKNFEYQKYILNFGNSDNDIKNEKRKQIPKKNYVLSNFLINKRNNSCLNINEKKTNKDKKSFLEYKVTFYHPGAYFLFKGDNDEYHAWSCCMNEIKSSKGCCQKKERIQIFNYDIIV